MIIFDKNQNQIWKICLSLHSLYIFNISIIPSRKLVWNEKLVYRIFVYEYECEIPVVIIELKSPNWVNVYVNFFLVFRDISRQVWRRALRLRQEFDFPCKKSETQRNEMICLSLDLKYKGKVRRKPN